MFRDAAWIPSDDHLEHVNVLVQRYRAVVADVLQPLVERHYPALLDASDGEYRKMIELSTKMTVVGHACSTIAGYEFDARRQTIAAMYGGCCFLADSFLDDFGEESARRYIDRFEELLTSGWFEVENEREGLFLVILTRLFSERDVMNPQLRQAIMLLFLAQKRDVELRTTFDELAPTSSRRRLSLLEECARNRSGHAIMALTSFLVPDVPLQLCGAIFRAGALIMHIDDHGDCYFDLRHNRRTYMNQLHQPARSLRRIFARSTAAIYQSLPSGEGRDVLHGFLYRYFVTRMTKHRIAREIAEERWAAYE